MRSSHERWDGGGYPDGLVARQIPLGSRIVAVCDAYEAMVSDRPYRRALGHEAACAELRSEAGRQFDPEVVEAFLEEMGHRDGVDAGRAAGRRIRRRARDQHACARTTRAPARRRAASC